MPQCHEYDDSNDYDKEKVDKIFANNITFDLGTVYGYLSSHRSTHKVNKCCTLCLSVYIPILIHYTIRNANNTCGGLAKIDSHTITGEGA